MRILIDMNLTPLWCDVLRAAGHDPVHWSSVGDPRADDAMLMQWARDNGCVVFTHDLDFAAILWATQASGPSVIQVRGQDTFPDALGAAVTGALSRFEVELNAGALVVVDAKRSRARVLPIS
jgi:predicted nuclease of predicted toxin-antitoxin system